MPSKVLELLLVEDDKIDREVVHRFLGRDDSWNLTDAWTGKEAIDLASQRRFDCLLLDYHLPDADGMDLLDRLVDFGMPVVMFTGSGSEDIAVEAMKRGAQDYLVKGKITGGSLRRAIHTAMEMVALKRKLASQQRQLAERTREAERRAAQLRYYAERLTETEQKERRRIAEVIHNELQQFMIAVAMRLDLLLESVESSELKELVRETRRLEQQLIDAARNLNKQLSPKILEHGDLDQALRWLGDWMAENHSLKVELRLENVVEPIKPELKTFLFESVRELLLNVVKHSGVDRASVTKRAGASGLEIIVEDRGRGFAFESRGEMESHEAGFGLFSIMERIDIFGGNVAVEAAEQKGCRVSISVPLTTPPEPSQPAESPPELPAQSEIEEQRKIRVLVADDHKIVREGLVSSLQLQCRCAVVGQAEDGQQTLEIARTVQPDVVIMDVNMPVLNGIEATRLLAEQHPDVAVIGLSVNDDAHTRDAMRQAGAVEYLVKDSAVNELCGAIANAVRNKKNRV